MGVPLLLHFLHKHFADCVVYLTDSGGVPAGNTSCPFDVVFFDVDNIGSAHMDLKRLIALCRPSTRAYFITDEHPDQRLRRSLDASALICELLALPQWQGIDFVLSAETSRGDADRKITSAVTHELMTNWAGRACRVLVVSFDSDLVLASLCNTSAKSLCVLSRTFDEKLCYIFAGELARGLQTELERVPATLPLAKDNGFSLRYDFTLLCVLFLGNDTVPGILNPASPGRKLSTTLTAEALLVPWHAYLRLRRSKYNDCPLLQWRDGDPYDVHLAYNLDFLCDLLTETRAEPHTGTGTQQENPGEAAGRYLQAVLWSCFSYIFGREQTEAATPVPNYTPLRTALLAFLHGLPKQRKQVRQATTIEPRFPAADQPLAESTNNGTTAVWRFWIDCAQSVQQGVHKAILKYPGLPLRPNFSAAPATCCAPMGIPAPRVAGVTAKQLQEAWDAAPFPELFVPHAKRFTFGLFGGSVRHTTGANGIPVSSVGVRHRLAARLGLDWTEEEGQGEESTAARPVVNRLGVKVKDVDSDEIEAHHKGVERQRRVRKRMNKRNLLISAKQAAETTENRRALLRSPPEKPEDVPPAKKQKQEKNKADKTSTGERKGTQMRKASVDVDLGSDDSGLDPGWIEDLNRVLAREEAQRKERKLKRRAERTASHKCNAQKWD
eukprot:TRINITY_DN10529_c0_g1_i1.p1 TRINITY_DN10529_c0_g1~~TRINITY_DN10529_c0_g1_i1.p1  ORF type:complete len:683 (-),score=114.61 TRINITY_DN10529_c0_g1_i1:873-2873(-)